MPDYLSREDASELCDRILSRSSGDAQVRILSGRRDFTEYVFNGISTSGDAVNVEVVFTSFEGQRRGSVRWNDLRDAAIQTAVARATALAKVVPEDPETTSLLGPQQYSTVGAFFESVSELTEVDQVDAVMAVAERAATNGVSASGIVQRLIRSEAVANTAGLFAYHRSTLASHNVTVRSPDGGGGSDATAHNDWQRLKAPPELGDRAIARARLGAASEPITLQSPLVVLAPAAVGSLLLQLIPELDARMVDQGRSYFSAGDRSKIGEQVLDERLTVLTDPADPDLLSRPFTDEGAPVGRTTWVENGVLRNLMHSRYWAAERGQAARLISGLKLTGGSGTVDELVAGVDRGLLVSCLAYVSPLDRSRLMYTAVARDGVYVIEGGRLAGAVSGLRFTESLASLLNSVESIGSAERVIVSEAGDVDVPLAAPPLAIRDVRFTSVQGVGR